MPNAKQRNPDPAVIRAFARLFIADSSLSRPPRQLVKDMLARIEALEKEREQLYNHKERMWAWKARAHVFAKMIRASRESNSILYLECESCSWMMPATELAWEADQAGCPTCGATTFLVFKDQVIIGNGDPADHQPGELFPTRAVKFITPCCGEFIESLVTEIGDKSFTSGEWECSCGQKWVVSSIPTPANGYNQKTGAFEFTRSLNPASKPLQATCVCEHPRSEHIDGTGQCTRHGRVGDSESPEEYEHCECLAFKAKSCSSTCKFCGQKFDKGSTLFVHIRDAHPAELNASLSKHFPDIFAESATGDGDTCLKCGKPIAPKSPLHYVMCSVLQGDEREKAIQTWCCDLCPECDKNLTKWLGRVRI